MFPSGVAYYDEELKYLARLLRASSIGECEAGLAALNSALTDDSGDSALSDLDDLDVEATIPLWRDGVDITLPFFRDLVTDKPVDGANKVSSLSNWSGTAIDSGGNGTRSGGKISWDGEAEKWYFRYIYGLYIYQVYIHTFNWLGNTYKALEVAVVFKAGTALLFLGFMITENYRKPEDERPRNDDEGRQGTLVNSGFGLHFPLGHAGTICGRQLQTRLREGCMDEKNGRVEDDNDSGVMRFERTLESKRFTRPRRNENQVGVAEIFDEEHRGIVKN
ncbi:hypothetical protein C8J57DRAFT_1255530 [Mycena rebaudengoi]|nr:hypothetical protein C8J57DRAFT_1255530 [Mycena rebaudengoi]